MGFILAISLCMYYSCVKLQGDPTSISTVKTICTTIRCYNQIPMGIKYCPSCVEEKLEQLDLISDLRPHSVLYCNNPNALADAFKGYSYKSKVGRTRKCVASGCSIQVPMELTYCDSCHTKFAKKDIWEVKDETFLPVITAISGIKLNKKENLTKCSKLLWE